LEEVQAKAMRGKILIILITLVAASCIQAQDVPITGAESEGARWTSEKLADRIFKSEQMTIAQVSKRAPMVETYIQSLDPEKTPEGLIDDAYFLGRTMLDPDSGQRSRLQLLTPEKKKDAPQIRVNTGDHWPLYPEGYVEMLFVDVADFDSDHYSLRYAGTESFGEKIFLRVEVRPLDPKKSGRFLGDIWVDSKSLRIARIAGTFSPKRLGFASKYLNASGISQLGLYFHFESWRQEVSPGIWVPSYTYFDEQRSVGSGNLATGFHLRGHVWTWGYQRTEIARAFAKLPASRAELEESGILASPGRVELVLNGIVEELENANGITSRPIGCRVLLTSPAEIFGMEDTVFVSRGLLNLVPNQSVLAALIAREIGQILSGDSRAQRGTGGTPAEAEPTAESSSIRVRLFEQADANERMRWLLKNTRYASAMDELELFLASLLLYSPRVPHLLKPLLGRNLLEQATTQPGVAQSVPDHLDASKAQNLELRGEYGVDSWESQIVSLGSQDSPGNSVAEASESTRSVARPAKRN
jgi:hypothetical protein